ncbi:prostasin-like [Cimex lectularius]|uniref:Peptidase S1 domain-containing protein n=1 Tax=Cimex lectularius TaxID=79782 RepID=A0A8I6R6U1_CIMLE|nr:prostasin-like [Cimex lectularius]
MASVRLKHSVVHFCTGALITEYFVASVATCFVRINLVENLYTFPDVQNIVVQLGSRYLETKVDPTFTIVEIENVLLHPKLQVDIRGIRNDAAILVTKRALPQQIKPVSFISYSEEKLMNEFTMLNKNELFCQLLGWAESPPSPLMADEQRIADDLISEALQVLKVRLVQDDECLYLLCVDNKNMCSLNFSDLNLFCVQAVKTVTGSCRSYVGNSLICGGFLWGLGSALTAGRNPCDGKNLPMVMIRPDLFINTMYKGIKVHVPIKSDAFTALPFIIFLVTISVVLLHF